MSETGHDREWLGMSEEEATELAQAGVEIPQYAMTDLRQRVRARARELCERRERDSTAIVPYVGGSSVGVDEAGPSGIRAESPEEDIPAPRRRRVEAVAEEQPVFRDIHMIPVPPAPVPAPVPSPVPSPDPLDDPVEQLTPPVEEEEDPLDEPIDQLTPPVEEEEDPTEDSDTDPAPLDTPPPPVAAPPPAAAPPPVAHPSVDDILHVALLSDYQTLQGQLAESRRMIDMLLQRSVGPPGRDARIPEGISLGLVSVEMRSLTRLRELTEGRGGQEWRAEVDRVITSAVAQLRDIIRAGLP